MQQDCCALQALLDPKQRLPVLLGQLGASRYLRCQARHGGKGVVLAQSGHYALGSAQAPTSCC